MKKIVLSLLFVAAFVISGTVAMADSITFWTKEEQPDRLAVQEKIAEEFKKATGHSVKVVPVTETDMHTRASAAFAAGNLPDVIYHIVPHLLPWAEAGILDPDAATEVIEDLGVDNFAGGMIGMAAMDDDYVSTPIDGGSQIMVYRKDLFDKAGLNAPKTYADIEAAIKKLHNPPEMYGFVAPTKVDENYMMQIIEHLCLANGYSPINADGSVNDNTTKLKEVLTLYKTMYDASPKGELFWKQSREQYLAGKAAMILWSGAILDELGGLRDSAPVTINDDPTTRELAQKSGFITAIAGPSNKDGSAFVLGHYFGITADANTDVAIEFVKYVLEHQYAELLSMSPENKLPAQKGYTEVWAKLPVGVDRKAPLSDLYPEDVINNLLAGLEVGERWGAKSGQLAKASKIINSHIMSQVFRKYADDDLTLDQAADEIVAGIHKLFE